jgi:hypothetical protein
MRRVIIGLLVVVSSATMAQDKKDHSYTKTQVSGPLSYSNSNKIPDGTIINCFSYTALTDIPDGKLKIRPYKLLLPSNTAILPSALRKDSLKK